MVDSQVPNIFAAIWQKVEVNSESKRISDYSDLRIFFENDRDDIIDYLKRILVYEKGLYSEQTWNKMVIRHRDNIQKPLNRMTTGIYENPPLREIYSAVDVLDEPNTEFLSEILEDCKYNQKVKDVFRKGCYYNCLEVWVQWDDVNKKIVLEVIIPDTYSVQTKDTDYTKKEKIWIQRYNSSSNYIDYVVYSDTEHYLINSSGEIAPPPDNPKMVNPYGKIPVIKFQIKEGSDYFGEPNWDLFDTQVSLDIKRTNNFYTEMFQTFSVGVATNLNLPNDASVSPGMLIRCDNVSKDSVQPSLTFSNPTVDWQALNDNIDFEVKDSLRSQGINAASSSLDQTVQSGASKEMDEIELIELRETHKEILYNFEKELIETILMVYNYHNGSNIGGMVEVTFSEEKTNEAIKDKVMRREFELKNGLKTPVDYIAEDLEVTKQEAEQIYQDNKNFNQPNTGIDPNKADTLQ